LLQRTQSVASKVGREPIGAMRDDIERAFGSSEGSLRVRIQPQASEIDGETEDAGRAETGPTFAPKADRRRGDRRGMDALRDEALRNVISRVEDRNFGGLRNRVSWRSRLPLSRIVLLLVALVAGGIAAFLATRGSPAMIQPATQPKTEVVQEARTQILVARQAIGIGQRLSPGSVEWVDWPQGAVRPEYITMAAVPGAITDMTGSVVRVEFFPGEPIRMQKLAQAGEGYLSAVLDTGMRGVSVSVAAESASGGFIVPNDHVDVVLTRTSGTGQIADTILHNVRVLAINARLGGGEAEDSDDAQAEVFSNTAIATLELDPTEAEVIINATTIGRLALVLRPMVDTGEASETEQRASNEAIRMSSPFWSNEAAGRVE
jgi:pilus assembly protein CpaB